MTPPGDFNLPFASAFRRRSVFVTGHTGFKGSWLSMWLHALGAKVCGYALPPITTPNNFAAARVAELLTQHWEGDIRDEAALSSAMDAADPDVIFHLAAQPLVRDSYATPRETFAVNVMGTCNVLECVRRRARPCVLLVISSDKCYENREQVWGYREDDRLGGHDPYSASKAAVEILVASYRQSFFPADECARHGIKLASARAGNVIGGGDWARDRIVPDIVRSLVARRCVELRNPRTVRPWQHVLEPLAGYLTLAAAMLASDEPGLCGGWNFGPQHGDDATVEELASEFCVAWGLGEWQARSDATAPHETKLLRLSIEKALFNLNWKPVWRFSEAVRRTVDWYRAFYARGGDVRDACWHDIQAYCEHASRQQAADIPWRDHKHIRAAS